MFLVSILDTFRYHRQFVPCSSFPETFFFVPIQSFDTNCLIFQLGIQRIYSNLQFRMFSNMVCLILKICSKNSGQTFLSKTSG